VEEKRMPERQQALRRAGDHVVDVKVDVDDRWVFG